MRLERVETFVVGNPWKNWVFCRVLTDDGVYGIGEGTLNGFARTVETAIHELFPLIRGITPFDTERAALVLGRDVYSDGGQIHGAALAALETAMWDLKGKYLHKPLYELLGGLVNPHLRVYANGWYRSDAGRTPEAFAAHAREVVARGYTALKFDPFGTAWRTMGRPDLNRSIDIVAAVREAVGPNVDVLVEGHNRFSVPVALEVARRLAPYHPTWFETPVPPHPIRALSRVAAQSPVPIACGEDYHLPAHFAELLADDAVGIVQLEPQYLGLTASVAVAAMAGAHNAVVAPHSAQGPLCSVVCAHFNAATPNFFLHEYFDDFNVDWEALLITPPLVMKDGFLSPPSGPGLGVDLNIEEARRHPYRQENFLPLFQRNWERRQGWQPGESE